MRRLHLAVLATAAATAVLVATPQLSVTAAPVRAAGGLDTLDQPAHSGRLTNLAHLDFLGDTVTPPAQAGHTTYDLASRPSVGTLWTYADHQADGTYRRVGGGAYDAATDTYGQGAFNADDMSRAAVVYLRDWKQTGAASSRQAAYRMLRGLTYLQTATGPNAGNVVLWMQPDGTLHPSADPKDAPDPSDSDASYWLARTIWALGEGYAAFRAPTPPSPASSSSAWTSRSPRSTARCWTTTASSCRSTASGSRPGSSPRAPTRPPRPCSGWRPTCSPAAPTRPGTRWRGSPTASRRCPPATRGRGRSAASCPGRCPVRTGTRGPRRCPPPSRRRPTRSATRRWRGSRPVTRSRSTRGCSPPAARTTAGCPPASTARRSPTAPTHGSVAAGPHTGGRQPARRCRRGVVLRRERLRLADLRPEHRRHLRRRRRRRQGQPQLRRRVHDPRAADDARARRAPRRAGCRRDLDRAGPGRHIRRTGGGRRPDRCRERRAPPLAVDRRVAVRRHRVRLAARREHGDLRPRRPPGGVADAGRRPAARQHRRHDVCRRRHPPRCRTRR